MPNQCSKSKALKIEPYRQICYHVLVQVLLDVLS